MRSFGKNTPQQHDPQRTIVHLKPNFPPSPVVGEMTVLQVADTQLPFMFINGSWQLVQTASHTIIPMGSEFPKGQKPGSLFFCTMPKDDETGEDYYGLYLVTEEGSFSKLLSEQHLTQSTTDHPHFLSTDDAISQYQPLKICNIVSNNQVVKLVNREFWPSNVGKNPIKIHTTGLYEFKWVLTHEFDWFEFKMISSTITEYTINTNPCTGRISNNVRTTIQGFIELKEGDDFIPEFSARIDVDKTAGMPSSFKLYSPSFFSLELIA